MVNHLSIRSVWLSCLGLLVAGWVGLIAPATFGQEDQVETTDESVVVEDQTAEEQAATTDTTEAAGDTESRGTVSPGGPEVEQPDAGEAITSTRSQLEQWVETRRIIAQEKQDLKLAKEMLNERIQLVQSEIEALKEKIKEAEANISKTDKQFNELTEENEKLKQASDTLLATIKALEMRMEKMLAGAPTPVTRRVQVLSQQIPDNPDETKLAITNRFQNVIGILNEINKFNSEITVVSEMRDLPGGGEAEVTVIYLGASKAYYVGGNGKFGGVGTPGEDGWDWKATDDVADRIAAVIEIYNNKQVAAFMELPFEVQ